ncbi:MAG: hypothetical protein M0Z41_06620 [Peptococcaceae bacterium]|jgi:hypothetical protein|nr:hypothetical protein [Peptococcaceae bacterium]
MNAGSFTELQVRWYSTFSLLAHGTAVGVNVMTVGGRRTLAWRLHPTNIGIAPLAAAACSEIISECEAGLNHPKAGWAKTYLQDITTKAIQAQMEFEKDSGIGAKP